MAALNQKGNEAEYGAGRTVRNGSTVKAEYGAGSTVREKASEDPSSIAHRMSLHRFCIPQIPYPQH